MGATSHYPQDRDANAAEFLLACRAAAGQRRDDEPAKGLVRRQQGSVSAEAHDEVDKVDALRRGDDSERVPHVELEHVDEQRTPRARFLQRGEEELRQQAGANDQPARFLRRSVDGSRGGGNRIDEVADDQIRLGRG